LHFTTLECRGQNSAPKSGAGCKKAQIDRFAKIDQFHMVAAQELVVFRVKFGIFSTETLKSAFIHEKTTHFSCILLLRGTEEQVVRFEIGVQKFARVQHEQGLHDFHSKRHHQMLRHAVCGIFVHICHVLETY